MATTDLLLEIGSEEIPAGYIPPAVARLADGLGEWLQGRGLADADSIIETFATPRRLAVRIRGVRLTQERTTERRMGPAVRAAFDEQGEPTKAALGFARSAGIDATDLLRVETDKGPRIAADVTVGGQGLAELMLAQLDLRELLQLGFPKTMRWIPGDDFRYARPVRWLVCLVGDEVVPMAVAGLEAGRESRGHRTLAPGPVRIASPAEYEAALGAASVIVDAGERRGRIDTAAREVASGVGGVIHEDPDLLDEVSFLVEFPTAVSGEFEPERVEQLPAEVIIAAMRSHQRYFSVEDGKGGLLPRFITFRDGGDRHLDQVREGNERVLRARLADAAFYWNEDRQMSSDEKLARLERVVWLEGYGSIREKCERIDRIAGGLADEFGLDVDRGLLSRAALLCKTDLATEMIRDGKEFTRLQGVIGRYYALEAGEPEEVADAIREHLHPRFAEDALPEGVIGTLLALADRLDTISGCVLAGFAPTGSQDPYALRRQVLAVLRILQDNGWHLDLDIWIERHLNEFPGASDRIRDAVDQVAALFRGRLETLLSALPAGIVRSVLSVSRLEPLDNLRAARALGELQGRESFERLLEGAKRCRNILAKEGLLAEEQADPSERPKILQVAAREAWVDWQRCVASEPEQFRVGAFVDPAEEALYRAARERIGDLAGAAAAQQHAAVFELLAELGPPIDRYFDEVLVNAEDAALRENRVRFLRQLHYLFARFADLSQIAAV